MDAITRRLGEIGLVPVVKLEDPADALPLGKALVAGGIPVAEVTFRTSSALESISAMSKGVEGLLVGAGTVTGARQAKDAAAAGARFIVSPAWVDEVVDFCLAEGLPVLPGVSGPDGAARGLAKGLEVLKFFPAEASGGQAMMDALSGPFPGLRFVPTGGIDATNVGAYAKKPSVHAIGGSWMVKQDAISAKDWAAVEKTCREAVMALHGFSFGHLGINNPDEAAGASVAGLLASLFGLGLKEGAGSIFAADSIEVMKKPFLGERGHIGIRCNNAERAVARFRNLGIGVKAETEKLEKGRLKTIYLDLEIGGFAIHLIGS
jgi:2-dehydro-3-deoxyphosphogluconate aldolase/(4S)-4-hydroxy-2-oxoglutarate aldolase